MSQPPFRGSPKIGRNDPCFCGSLRKFKNCHGGIQHSLPSLLARDKFEKQIIEQGRLHFEKHKVQEIQRQKQQGHGRPIISTEHKGYRFIAVGNQMHYGKWKSFPDFLANYIKHSLGGDWGNNELAKPLEDRHPLIQWYDKICRLQAAHAKEPGALFSTPVTGAVSAYNRLAYNLYLIAHNGKDIQTRLIQRLKNRDNFQGAFFESQVAAWLIKAGFELEFEDESDRTSKHCEFTATHIETGDKYSVEAKSREIESLYSSRAKVGRKLYEALVKKADHKRLIFLDLNKPLHTEEAAQLAADRAERIVRQSENLRINDEPAPSAYICVTNMNDQYLLDRSSLSMMASFSGFKIHDFMGSEFSSLRQAARAREKHWPMFQLLKSMNDHREIPQTFEGELPSEVFSSSSMPRLKIGSLYMVPGPDGVEINAKLVQATVIGEKAHCVLSDSMNTKSWICTFDMTQDELADHAKHPDTYFGTLEPKAGRIETAIDMFDFFVSSYRKTEKQRLIELLAAYSGPEDIEEMDQKHLVELFAELSTMSAIAQGFAIKPQRQKRGRSN